MAEQNHWAVHCRDLRKTYRTGGNAVPALRGVNLTVRPGELVMLVGPSGCGKTTLISVIAGVLNHDGGVCEVFGQSWDSLPGSARTRRRGRTVGFVFQTFQLLPSLTARENVSVPLLLQGVRRRQAEDRAGHLLERVGLAGEMDRPPPQLSGGQQQRVAIARALIHDPHLVVCDEPTSSLDAENGARIMDLLRQVVHSQGKTLLVVTHDSRIFPYADRIVRLNDGAVTGEMEAAAPNQAA